MIYLGIDTGGTFTDFVLFKDGQIRVHKVLSTPGQPEQAILAGISDLGISTAALRVIHGSTVATNAVLEGKGVDTLFITNRGFTDLLTIGRQNREQLYNLQPAKIPPPVAADHCIGVGGRLDAQGELLEPLTAEDLRAIAALIEDLQPRAVAINLLFSFLDDSAEQAIARSMPDGLFCSLSSEVLPEIKEYERGMATWLNAWVGPLVEGYLQRLDNALPEASISVMQSSGDTVAARQAAQQAVRMLLSGPAGGLVGAQLVAPMDELHNQKLLTFDMGGTSTDVALIDGVPRLTNEGRIGRYPVAVPMVDMHTIGAGGGSIAWLDAGGMLQVGPESAGADPGPACYGRGGKRPTVTDANLVLGRLHADAFLGGRMHLDVAAAELAVNDLAEAMGCTLEVAAAGIIEVANEHMALALRQISVQRGIDPRGYTLVSFGGAGGLHVCALADALELDHALVPIHGGVLSALGMLNAKPGRHLSRTWLEPLDDLSSTAIQQGLDQLAEQGYQALLEEGVAPADCSITSTLDLRYEGQSYTLEIPWHSRSQAIDDFHQQHKTRYGHDMDLPVELVNIRVAVSGPGLAIQLVAPVSTNDKVSQHETVIGFYQRTELSVGQSITGPAIIAEEISTTWLEQGWVCAVDTIGNLQLHKTF